MNLVYFLLNFEFKRIVIKYDGIPKWLVDGTNNIIIIINSFISFTQEINSYNFMLIFVNAWSAEHIL